jgi:hypothetical protein
MAKKRDVVVRARAGSLAMTSGRAEITVLPANWDNERDACLWLLLRTEEHFNLLKSAISRLEADARARLRNNPPDPLAEILLASEDFQIGISAIHGLTNGLPAIATIRFTRSAAAGVWRTTKR